MLRKLSLSFGSFMLFFLATAQDSSKTLSFSGSVDAYYRYNFSGKQNNFTSFTNSQSSFELGMASVRADATALKGKATATVDLGFGPRAEEFSYPDGEKSAGKNGFATLTALKQAFITYNVSPTVKLTAGKFATHVGYELLDATSNMNYSMSYMFTNGPFSHTGLKADITAGALSMMIGISNFTDQATSTTSVKNLIAQVSGSGFNSKLKFYLNYSGFTGSKNGDNPSGLQSLQQADAVLTATISSKFNIGYNGTIQFRKPTIGNNGNWFGNALYLNLDPTEKFGLTLRSEYISDEKMIFFNTKNIFANTLSANIKLGPLTVIPELRFESAQSPIYTKSNGAGVKSTGTGLMAVVYKF